MKTEARPQGVIVSPDNYELEKDIHERIESHGGHLCIIKCVSFKNNQRELHFESLYQCETLHEIIVDAWDSQIRFSEDVIRGVFQKLVSGVHWLHSMNIVHRDLTTRNIIFDSESESLKIINFGTSKVICEQKPVCKGVVLQAILNSRKRPCPFQADILALGNVLYALTQFCDVKISPAVTNLLNGILAQPPQIVSIAEVLHHSWVTPPPPPQRSVQWIHSRLGVTPLSAKKPTSTPSPRSGPRMRTQANPTTFEPIPPKKLVSFPAPRQLQYTNNPSPPSRTKMSPSPRAKLLPAVS